VIAARLEAECRAIGLPFEARWVAPITAHLELLERWAPRVNLTSISEPATALTRHVVDSLGVLGLECVREARGKAIDVGSGGGFPGIPLAVALPELSWILLEPRGKRGSFLTQVIARAGLKNASWKSGRLPDASLDGAFDVVVSRATFNPPELLARVGALVADGGVVVMMTAEDPPAPPDGWREHERFSFRIEDAPRTVSAFSRG
jgi:16S rRNA (guanine527-N7)-methyltransferase